MLVGPTGGGKTKIFRCLRTALDKTMGITHKDSRFNPKAIRAQEMYGEVDPSTGEWNTGMYCATCFSIYLLVVSAFRKLCWLLSPGLSGSHAPSCCMMRRGSPHRREKRAVGSRGRESIIFVLGDVWWVFRGHVQQ